MNDILLAYIMVTGLLSFVCILLFLFDNEHRMFFSPNYIYKHSKLNMFGCIMCSILIMLIMPYYILLAFIYYIIHVGRKDIN